jgi:hypothetical protein
MEKHPDKLQLALPDSKPEFVIKLLPGFCAAGIAVSPPAIVLLIGGGVGGGWPGPPEDEGFWVLLLLPHPVSSKRDRQANPSQFRAALSIFVCKGELKQLYLFSRKTQALVKSCKRSHYQVEGCSVGGYGSSQSAVP